jgi:hypothetical protein
MIEENKVAEEFNMVDTDEFDSNFLFNNPGISRSRQFIRINFNKIKQYFSKFFSEETKINNSLNN